MREAKGCEDDIPAQIEDSPFPLTDTDRWVLSQTDEEFRLHDWDELREIIGRWRLCITISVWYKVANIIQTQIDSRF